MLVMILAKAPTSLRGELSRWLLEPTTGVFLGNPSRRVRDELWAKACKKIKAGTVTQIWTARTEQGFSYRQHGPSDRNILEYEGVALVTRFKPPKKEKKKKNSVSPTIAPSETPKAAEDLPASETP